VDYFLDPLSKNEEHPSTILQKAESINLTGNTEVDFNYQQKLMKVHPVPTNIISKIITDFEKQPKQAKFSEIKNKVKILDKTNNSR